MLCRSLGLQSYAIWANWAAQGVSSQLLASLRSDVALRADAPLRGWEETVVSSEAGGDAAEELLLLGGDASRGGGGGGASGRAGAAAGGELAGEVGGVGEMRFWLPAVPSPAAMEAAMGACREANHAGKAAGGGVGWGAGERGPPGWWWSSSGVSGS